MINVWDLDICLSDEKKFYAILNQQLPIHTLYAHNLDAAYDALTSLREPLILLPPLQMPETGPENSWPARCLLMLRRAVQDNAALQWGRRWHI